MLGRYIDALHRIKDEELSPQKISDFRLLIEWYNLYASAIYINGDLISAKKKYKFAQKLSKNLGYFEGFATALWGIGDILSVQRKYSRSIKYYLDALFTFDALGRISHCLTINRNIAEVYIDFGRYSEARQYADRANDLFASIDQRYNEFYLLFTKLKLSIIESNIKEFSEICKKLRCLITDCIATTLLIQLLVLLVVAYIDRGYSTKTSKYYDFLSFATKQVDKNNILTTIGKPELYELILHPDLYHNYSNSLIQHFRSIVFHSDDYLNLN